MSNDSKSSQIGVSIVICTRNRGASAIATIESVLANTYPNFELLLVDQSMDDRTKMAISPFLSTPHFRYIRTNTVGAGNARQIGLMAASGDVVAYTDDDCIVPSDWLESIVDVFAKDQMIGVVFCSVIAAAHDTTSGTIPNHAYQESRTLKTVQEYYQSIGMGAGMAVRRSAGLSIGGFDRSLGPGSRFYSAEDHDIALRALLNNWSVHENAQVSVIHDGFRKYSEFRNLTRRDWYAIGAVHAKLLKCKHWSILLLVAYNTLGRGIWQPLASLRARKKPQGFKRFIFYWEGFVAGLGSAVDRKYLLYEPNDPPQNPLRNSVQRTSNR